MIKTNFFTCSNRAYELFIPIYTYFVLRNNLDSSVEIVVEDDSALERLQPIKDSICKIFGQRFHLRTGDFSNKTPNIVRFIERPQVQSKYTYIGDIDILVIQDITSWHVDKMAELDLHHSNIIRRGSKRLTGLHFCETDYHYPIDCSVYDIYSETVSTDEEFLYKFYESKGQLPPMHHRIRPVHGIHISLNRYPYDEKGWGINSEFIDETLLTLEDLKKSELYSVLSDKSLWLLNVIENVLEAKKIFNADDLRSIRFLHRTSKSSIKQA